MQSVRMGSVAMVLGPHAYMLTRYGVSPEEDVDTAVAKLKARAPHLATSCKKYHNAGCSPLPFSPNQTRFLLGGLGPNCRMCRKPSS